ncbi:MAG: DTW domain-containing protein [Planctomycetota bacterium]
MGRSVVRAGAVRCHACRLAPRWCVCRALPQATTAIQVDVLMHPQEQCKPSSTGKLIERAVQGARCQLYQRGLHQHGGPSPPSLAALQAPELWILHPLGEPLESIQSVIDSSTHLRVLLLDGNWSQAGEMLRTVESMGRCVRLRAAGPSRYWLRDQREPSHISTAEALLGVFNAVGDTAAEDQFRLHFELHVYASLRARGRRQLAEDYLQDSPLKAAIPDFLERLNARRP